jgi:hypothetical protein
MQHAPAVNVKVFSRDFAADRKSYTLTDITSSCDFHFFSPYKNVGSRLDSCISVDNTGLITPLSLGITFLYIIYQETIGSDVYNHYQIARVQVHDDILGWWFGNKSLTVPMDNTIAHTQPSLYGVFSDDAAAGTDLVGDITGHGYVSLTPADNTIIALDAHGRGRLRGIKEGATTLNGNFLGINASIPVKVTDYKKNRTHLKRVKFNGPAADMHNILFLAEGFDTSTDDRERFDKLVTNATEKLFSSSSHSPYGLLKDSFNVWKAFEPSTEGFLTLAPRINDEDAALNGTTLITKGYPVPYEYNASSDDDEKNKYKISEFVRKVGLPLRNESRSAADLKALWQSQSLDHLDIAKISDRVIAVWKKQKSLGILEANDTFFGLYLGQRPADKRSDFDLNSSVLPPLTDDPANPALAPYVKRIYEWFRLYPSRTISPDPRRHPPELYAGNLENFGNSTLAYIGSLHDSDNAGLNVGQQWQPDPLGANFIKSRGLIAVICKEVLTGGTNMNALTMTANTLNRNHSVEFEYTNTAVKKVLKRKYKNFGFFGYSIDEEDVINTISHEFGHSFNLNDEYEEFPGDARDGEGDSFDNLASISSIFLNAGTYRNDRLIEPDKIKWFDLLRIELSASFIKDSEVSGGDMKIYIDPANISLWTAAKAANKTAYVRKRDITARGQQLPFKHGDDYYLVNLDIGTINEAAGTILVGGLEMPVNVPVFPKGSLLFIPKRDDSNNLMFVVEKPVLDFIKSSHQPLNQDTNHTDISTDQDVPVSIPNYKAPCKSYKIIGAFEGGSSYPGLTYRPSGQCKMRNSGSGEFCFVCKYLIVNRVNGTLLSKLEEEYPKGK